MKQYTILSTALLSFILFCGCGEMRDIVKADSFEPLTLHIKAKTAAGEIHSIDSLGISLDNYREEIHIRKNLSSPETEISEITPGLYNINIGGRITTTEKETYMVNGSRVNYPIIKQNDILEIVLSTARLGDLIFSEIFYAGTPRNYFRNQFYEIYNNSEQTQYLDGLYFANLTPGTANLKLPQWPESDKDKYCYAERIWQFPGSGTDYPVLPGEAIVISQFAANHKLPQYSPNSPIDGSSSEFEFNMNNPNFPNQPALDMKHIFYDGSSNFGRIPQYLTSVFGGAYVIFEVPEGETYDPVNNPELSTPDLSSTSPRVYGKIPIQYVLDAVECGHNESMVAAKRVPGVLDSGMSWVGQTYNSQGIARKKIGERVDGSPILKDTNNSTEDFDRGVTPQFRRYGSRMPAWNHSLTK